MYNIGECIILIKRGEIYLANLNPSLGSEQSGIRPVLIIQNDTGNRYSPTVIVLAITSKEKKNIPTHVKIGAMQGLEKDSVVLVEQVRTVDKERLIKKLGMLSFEKMQEIKEALKISLNIRCNFDNIFFDW